MSPLKLFKPSPRVQAKLACTNCGWKGTLDDLATGGKCPNCGSINLKYA